jgi:Ran GTPase-activating protein (RanGAP) involved in mRNA processing and transport
VLPRSPRFSHLYLQNNHIGAEGAERLARVMAQVEAVAALLV